jgi:hypothetical protein
MSALAGPVPHLPSDFGDPQMLVMLSSDQRERVEARSGGEVRPSTRPQGRPTQDDVEGGLIETLVQYVDRARTGVST